MKLKGSIASSSVFQGDSQSLTKSVRGSSSRESLAEPPGPCRHHVMFTVLMLVPTTLAATAGSRRALPLWSRLKRHVWNGNCLHIRRRPYGFEKRL
ncbi:hypothetical protein SRHO_G00150340 [Serrasalmus rhombeus]